MKAPVIDRLMARVVKRPDGCWIFTGARTGGGYGSIGLGGRALGTDYAHRIAYRELVGPIPDGLDLDHLCRVRECCNPAHLEPVTRQTNLLRGGGWAARNAAKTHCIRGHEFNEENTRRVERGRRQCRACDQIRSNRKKAA